jgi:hypothetical protein
MFHRKDVATTYELEIRFITPIQGVSVLLVIFSKSMWSRHDS